MSERRRLETTIYTENLRISILFLFFLLLVLSMATERHHFELAKGINGLDKIVLRESRGRSAEVNFHAASCSISS